MVGRNVELRTWAETGGEDINYDLVPPHVLQGSDALDGDVEAQWKVMYPSEWPGGTPVLVKRSLEGRPTIYRRRRSEQ
jgi:hypothetical protein